jgi:hypothetical protein
MGAPSSAEASASQFLGQEQIDLLTSVDVAKLAGLFHTIAVDVNLHATRYLRKTPNRVNNGNELRFRLYYKLLELADVCFQDGTICVRPSTTLIRKGP